MTTSTTSTTSTAMSSIISIAPISIAKFDYYKFKCHDFNKRPPQLSTVSNGDHLNFLTISIVDHLNFRPPQLSTISIVTHTVQQLTRPKTTTKAEQPYSFRNLFLFFISKMIHRPLRISEADQPLCPSLYYSLNTFSIPSRYLLNTFSISSHFHLIHLHILLIILFLIFEVPLSVKKLNAPHQAPQSAQFAVVQVARCTEDIQRSSTTEN